MARRPLLSRKRRGSQRRVAGDNGRDPWRGLRYLFCIPSNLSVLHRASGSKSACECRLPLLREHGQAKFTHGKKSRGGRGMIATSHSLDHNFCVCCSSRLDSCDEYCSKCQAPVSLSHSVAITRWRAQFRICLRCEQCRQDRLPRTLAGYSQQGA